MIRLNVKAEFGPLLRKLDGLQEDIKNTVIARTLNRVGDSTKTQAVTEISREFNITAAKTRERIKVVRAFAKTKLQVEIKVESKYGRRSTNLITFGATQRKRGGVSVRIKRSSKRSAGGKKWFIVNAKSSSFVAKRVGRGMKDIAPVTTIDVGQMFNVKKINAKLLSNVRARFPIEFDKQLEFALSKFKS